MKKVIMLFIGLMIALVAHASVPDIPTNVVGTPGNGEISVAFSPGSIGTGTLVAYWAACGPDNLNLVYASGTSIPITVSGLSNGTVYYCWALTESTDGDSGWSLNSSPVIPVPTVTGRVPGAPTGVNVSPGNGRATVEFLAPSDNGGAAISSYRTTCGTAVATGSGSPIIVGGLSNGVTYSCAVLATNSVGNGASSVMYGVTPTTAVIPTSGLWVIDSENNGQPGRGFQMAIQNGVLVLTIYGYKAGGTAQWYLSAGSLANGSFSGTLDQYIGGAAFGSTYSASHTTGNAGSVSLTFYDSSHGYITLPGESTKSVSLMNFGGSAVASLPITPSDGLWVIDTENNGQPGRGFQIVVQSGVMVLTFYGYRSDGSAQWYLSAGSLSNSSFSGTLDEYVGGMAFGGTYTAAHMTQSAGTVGITFTDSTHGRITLPGESAKNISLMSFAPAAAADGVLTGQSADQQKFIVARGYPHLFSITFVTQVMSGGRVVTLTPPRRLETWVYNDGNVTSALFDNGFFISQETLGAHTTFQSTSLKPEKFKLGMTESEVIAVVGQPTCVDSVSMLGSNMRFLRYAKTTDSPVASVGLLDGKLTVVSAGFLLSTQSDPGTDLCSAPLSY